MSHEFDGKKYEKASAHQKEWGAAVIAELGLSGHERVLDLGCGSGVLTSRLAELLPHGEVIGIDASRGMIDVARSKERHNLSFLVKDIDELDFDNEFDLVFSNAALHWVKDHERLLPRIATALREGGVARFNFAGEGNCSNFFRIVKEAMAQEEFSPYFRRFEWPWYMPAAAQYRQVALEAGLQEVKVWDENADRFFPDSQAMLDWIDQPSLVPFLGQVAEHDRGAFREYVVGRMVRETRRQDGRCFETFRRINLLARKKAPATM